MAILANLKPLLAQVEKTVFNCLPVALYYHNKAHTRHVWASCIRLARVQNLSAGQQRILYAAAILHDTGYVVRYPQNEVAATALARQMLPEFGYTKLEIEEIKAMILATNPNIAPKTHLEVLLVDADMSYLGQPDFLLWSNKLLEEWRAYDNFNGSNTDWLRNQREFLEAFRFESAAAKQIFNPGLLRNRAQLAQLSDWPF